MAPTYTMSAHLCKQICSSWRQTRQPTDGSALSSHRSLSPDSSMKPLSDQRRRSSSSSTTSSSFLSSQLSRLTSNDR
uniref:Uncharacterized protein n=1 Tax=Bionectria ochroleuca TaxID=29856 RepID=A0A8H7KD59_BIOOC